MLMQVRGFKGAILAPMRLSTASLVLKLHFGLVDSCLATSRRPVSPALIGIFGAL